MVLSSNLSATLPALLYRLACFFVCRLTLFCFAFVVELLAFGQGNFALGATIVNIHLERHQRQPLLGGFSNQLAQLTAMQQQLPRPQRIVIHPVSVAVRTDVTIQQPDLSVLYETVAVLEIDLTFANRLDLGSLQHHAGFKGFEYVVVMVGLAIETGCFVSMMPHCSTTAQRPRQVTASAVLPDRLSPGGQAIPSTAIAVLIPKRIEGLKPLWLCLLWSHADGLIGVGWNRLHSGLARDKTLNWRILGRSRWNRLGLHIGVVFEGRFNAAAEWIFQWAVR